MQTTATLEQGYPGWVAPASRLPELADLMAFHHAQLPSTSLPRDASAAVPVQAAAAWTQGRRGPRVQRDVQGTVTDIVAAVTGTAPSSVSLTSHGMTGQSIALRWSTWQGCSLTVRGDPAWATATATALSHALRAHQRAWRWLYQRPAQVLLSVLPLLVALPGIVSRAATPAGARTGSVLLVALLGLGMAAVAALDRIPPFELTESQTARTARRARAFLTGYAVTLTAAALYTGTSLLTLHPV